MYTVYVALKQGRIEEGEGQHGIWGQGKEVGKSFPPDMHPGCKPLLISCVPLAVGVKGGRRDKVGPRDVAGHGVDY